jgi:MFS family permease
MASAVSTNRLPRVVWILGLASLCMDLSSEMIHSLLPVFLVSVLGASAGALGLIEGVAEGTASIAKVFSGVWSDRLGRRKPLVVFGYGLAACMKPLFPLASGAGSVLFARFADRLGKGIRGAPRDALVADVTPPEQRGAAYGLRQSLDTLGAVLGPILAIALMAVLIVDVRTVFWIAVLPAWIAVALLAFGIDEPATHADGRPPRAVPHWRDLQQLSAAYWSVVVIGALFTLARFSEAFLVLRAHDAGLALAWTPLVLVVMNLTYVVSAYPAGRLSDRIGRSGLLIGGLALLIAADVILALSTQLGVTLAGIAVWGLHLGLTQGLLSALVADTAPESLRGSAFGVYHLIGGVATLVASLLAGVLWEAAGPSATFFAGAVCAALALIGIAGWQKWLAADPSTRRNS